MNYDWFSTFQIRLRELIRGSVEVYVTDFECCCHIIPLKQGHCRLKVIKDIGNVMYGVAPSM